MEEQKRGGEEVAKRITSHLERLLKKGADKDIVAQGLVGVGTVEAMDLRERLLTEGVVKDFVAYSLAGVGTPEGFEFREHFFSDNPTVQAKSFQTGWAVTNGIICRYGYEK